MGRQPGANATYAAVFPESNDGHTPYGLTVGDVPVDGFWSITVYDEDGYLAANPQNRYSVNGVTAVPDPSGSVTVQFGGDEAKAPNWLPIVPKWNYVVRLYRPRPETCRDPGYFRSLDPPPEPAPLPGIPCGAP